MKDYRIDTPLSSVDVSLMPPNIRADVACPFDDNGDMLKKFIVKAYRIAQARQKVHFLSEFFKNFCLAC